jgi:hypothetical protein
VLLVLIIIGFALAFYWLNKPAFDFNEASIFEAILQVLFFTFADFSQTSDSWEHIDWVLFMLAIFIICFIMMNLLIGLLSEKLAEVLEDREKIEF